MAKICPILSIRPNGIIDTIDCMGSECQFFDTDQDDVCIIFQLRKVKSMLKDIKDLLIAIRDKL